MCQEFSEVTFNRGWDGIGSFLESRRDDVIEIWSGCPPAKWGRSGGELVDKFRGT